MTALKVLYSKLTDKERLEILVDILYYQKGFDALKNGYESYCIYIGENKEDTEENLSILNRVLDSYVNPESYEE